MMSIDKLARGEVDGLRLAGGQLFGPCCPLVAHSFPALEKENKRRDRDVEPTKLLILAPG